MGAKHRSTSILLSLTISATLAGVWMTSSRSDDNLQRSSTDASSSHLPAEKGENIPPAPTKNVIPPSLITFTEEFVGLSFAKEPSPLLGDHELILDAASQKWSEIDFDYFVKVHYALEAIGVVHPQLNLGHQLITADTLGSRGAYDHGAKQIILSEDIDFESIPDQAEVIKLLTIALIHQSKPTSKIKTLQEYLTRRSVEIGAASLATERFYAISSRHFEGTGRHKLTEEEQIAFDHLSLLAKHLTLFPVREGYEYMKNLERESNATMLSGSIPSPKSTYSILGLERKEHFFITAPGNLEFQDHLGPAITSISLGDTIAPEDARQLITKLGDDKISILTLPDSQEIKILWQTKWLTPEAATEFFQGISKKLSNLPHIEVIKEDLVVSTIATQSNLDNIEE